ncbi:MAG: SpoIID/LytB domain-containing protein, partial [Selenomonadaceae bacterium]|nr:SpoIID/LytB domain-containing protein [Selenomonadaceae bacterium]
TAIRCSAYDARCYEAFSGAADACTHDCMPHGSLIGDEVESSRFFCGWYEDIRTGLEEFGRVCMGGKEKFSWDGPVPFGWNSYAGLNIEMPLMDHWKEAADFIDGELPEFRDAEGRTTINLDGNFFQDKRKMKQIVDELHRRGQLAGNYMSPLIAHKLLGFIPLRGTPGKTMKITVEDGNLVVDGKKVNASRLILRPQEKKPISTMKVTINGYEYPGGADIQLMRGSMVVNNLVACEDYLRGVLPEEMPPDWPEDALKAQAVAARTYALKHRGRHEKDGYDLCDTTHCQVYEGLDSATARTDKAVSDTYGEVLTYQDKLIEAYFHTDSGGMTERCSDVWGTEVPYLQAAKELQINTQPWTVNYSIKDFSDKLAAASRNVGTVKQVTLSKLSVGKGASDRSASGRVKSLVVKGDKGTKTITGNEMRSILKLRSTLFDVNISKNQVMIAGYGWGHGLGLSQWGAKAYADKWSYDKILYHYYKDTKLKKLY